MTYPDEVLHWIGGERAIGVAGETYDKMNPHDGTIIARVARGMPEDARLAVDAAVARVRGLGRTPVVTRGDDPAGRDAAHARSAGRRRPRSSAAETGKSRKDASGEVGAAIEMGFFMAGEGASVLRPHNDQRRAQPLRDDGPAAGRSGRPDHRRQHADRQRRLEGLPGAPVRQHGRPQAVGGHARDGAWFCAACCTRPASRRASSRSSRASGTEAGAPLVEDERVRLVSFTGSVPVGRWIQRIAGERLAKVCLELGGKNPLVVCDDADLDAASARGRALGVQQRGPALRVRAAASSSSTSSTTTSARRFLERTRPRCSRPGRRRRLGPVINERQLTRILGAIERARPRTMASPSRAAGRGSTTRPTPAATTSRRPCSRTPRPTRASRATRCSVR